MNINDKITQSIAETVKSVMDIQEASASDIKKILAAAKKAGADIKGNQIDFGEGSVIEVSIEKGKIKFDGGMSTGVEYFNNAKDAIMAFESNDIEETEVQDADKDFVDLHNTDAKEDPEQKKYTEEKEEEDEEDVEEGNAFGQAVTDAKKAGKKKFTFQGKEYKVESTDLEEGKSVKVKTRTGSDKYDYDELLPEVQKIVIMSDAVQKNKRMDVAKKITKSIIDGKIKNADISSDLATLIGIDQPYAGAAPRGVVKDRMKELKFESVDLEEAKMSQGFQTATTQLYALEQSLKVGSNLNKGINKTLGDNFNEEFKKMEKSLGQILNIWEEIEMAMSFAESTDLEEALSPKDFVNGGDEKITQREVDSMLSKLFGNDKMLKSLEANKAYKDGYAGKTKNPYKKDTADYHLFILGQQSADADAE